VYCSTCVKQILVGYRMVDLLEQEDAFKLLTGAGYRCDKHMSLMCKHGIEAADFEWVSSLGGFRVAYQMV